MSSSARSRPSCPSWTTSTTCDSCVRPLRNRLAMSRSSSTTSTRTGHLDGSLGSTNLSMNDARDGFMTTGHVESKGQKSNVGELKLEGRKLKVIFNLHIEHRTFALNLERSRRALSLLRK